MCQKVVQGYLILNKSGYIQYIHNNTDALIQ